MTDIADGVTWVCMFYPSPMIGAPCVLVIDVPPENRGRGLALGRYYAMIIETDTEREEVEHYLSTPRSRLVTPDLLDHRPSNIRADDVVISRYDPPAPGRPWLSVTRWPDTYAEAALARGITMARGRYTMEMFDAADGLAAHSAAMIEALAAHHPIEVRFLSAGQLSAAGTHERSYYFAFIFGTQAIFARQRISRLPSVTAHSRTQSRKPLHESLMRS